MKNEINQNILNEISDEELCMLLEEEEINAEGDQYGRPGAAGLGCISCC